MRKVTTNYRRWLEKFWRTYKDGSQAESLLRAAFGDKCSADCEIIRLDATKGKLFICPIMDKILYVSNDDAFDIFFDLLVEGLNKRGFDVWKIDGWNFPLEKI